ncbi:DMT family transporter, partial [uncultured Brevundimonas sp.]|uniref:DMT family transporter n=1 Tax=uncultured Brevundimonas sp. TaxID=213418 RepID=UPI0025F2E844
MSAMAFRPSSRAFALIVLLIAASVLGLAPILVRLTETGPAAAGFWRFLFALPLLTILAAREPGGVGGPSKWALLAGLFFALDLSFWHYGIVMTSVANATVLCNLTPVVVTLFGWFVLKERPHRLFILALALAMGGAFAMAAGADGGQGTNPMLGDLFSLSVAVWYSGYFLAVQAARRTAGAMRVTFWATLLGAPLLLIVALALGEAVIPAGPAGWAACVAMGVMHVFGQGGVAWARSEER